MSVWQRLRFTHRVHVAGVYQQLTTCVGETRQTAAKKKAKNVQQKKKNIQQQQQQQQNNIQQKKNEYSLWQDQ